MAGRAWRPARLCLEATNYAKCISTRSEFSRLVS